MERIRLIYWLGCFHYPWAFSIHDFEPITGRIHQPPPVHQTFEGNNFVILFLLAVLLRFFRSIKFTGYVDNNFIAYATIAVRLYGTGMESGL